MNQEAPAEGADGGRILIACVGNIFFGDDGFGVEVAQRLLSREKQPRAEHVEIVDFGIRGLDLAYTLLNDYKALVLVDAVPRGGAPGMLYLIEPDLAHAGPEQGAEAGRVAIDSHSMDPVKVLAFARTLGARPISHSAGGLEPLTPANSQEYGEMSIGLSEPVMAAIDEAVGMIDSLVERLLTDNLAAAEDRSGGNYA